MTRLLAISDMHVAYPENRDFVGRLRPVDPADWLVVAGDVGELSQDIEWALGVLRERFATVVWAPGNHELWTPRGDPLRLRGEARYEHLVDVCRRLGVHSPEDPYPVWDGPGGPAIVAPLFTLYDYTFRLEGTSTKEESLALAYERGVVCTDEMLLHPDPYPSREAWCAARIAETEIRLSTLDPDLPVVFVNHYPLVREPTRVLYYPEFAQWCGTVHTADWHRRYRTAAVVYGHLHIPRTTWHDGVRFEEVSVGYPREWRRRGARRTRPARSCLSRSVEVIEEILPAAVVAEEAFADPDDIKLFPEEEAVVARAVAKRRNEFATARHCARVALRRLGVAPVPILPGERGAPRWPAGIVGSMTHCVGYRAAVLAHRWEVVTIGVDAEPHDVLPDGVLDAVAVNAERAMLARLAAHAPEVCWDRLLFSAKESVYKAWYPLAGRWLNFTEAEVAIDPIAARFVARLLVPGPLVAGHRWQEFDGRYLVRNGLVVTAIVILT